MSCKKEYYDNGKIKQITFYEQQDLVVSYYHREDGPAVIMYDNYGNVIQEKYYINSKLHREDGPAIIKYREDGSIKEETYYLNGLISRIDNPSVIEYSDNADNSVKCKKYIVENKFHRLDGPAYIEYYSDGVLAEESYLVDGNVHREDGPAVTFYNTDGKIYEESYHLYNTKIEIKNDINIHDVRSAKDLQSLLELKLSIMFNKQDNKDELLEVLESKLLIFNMVAS